MLGTVEFYVVLLTVAALAIAFLAIPQGRGPVVQSFATARIVAAADLQDSELSTDSKLPPSQNNPEPTFPLLELRCLPDGTVELRRFGLTNLSPSDTLAIAINRKGFDLDIQERYTHAKQPITPPAESLAKPQSYDSYNSYSSYKGPSPSPQVAIFTISGLAPQERYTMKYNSDHTSSFAALTFRTRPGLISIRPFQQ